MAKRDIKTATDTELSYWLERLKAQPDTPVKKERLKIVKGEILRRQRNWSEIRKKEAKTKKTISTKKSSSGRSTTVATTQERSTESRKVIYDPRRRNHSNGITGPYGGSIDKEKNRK